MWKLHTTLTPTAIGQYHTISLLQYRNAYTRYNMVQQKGMGKQRIKTSTREATKHWINKSSEQNKKKWIAHTLTSESWTRW